MLFPKPSTFLDEVEAIARIGADALMPYWRKLKDEEISEKSRNDLVTTADHASEDAILNAIKTSYPSHAVLAEESGKSDGEPAQPRWIIDPLDGTTNFVHGFPHFAVSIGVQVGANVDFGVIFDPVKNDLFRAARGHGASWNGKKMAVSRRPNLDGALITTGFPFRAHAFLDCYLAIFREVFLRAKALRRPGAASLDLAYTACGIFDGFFEFDLSPWDLAAGTLLVEEAGGLVTDMEGGQGFLESGDVACGSFGVHRDVLAAARKILASGHD
ncbi:MAG: inositol monophosphatase [bacterium]|nr:inositol monophosphatase [bacterium]